MSVSLAVKHQRLLCNSSLPRLQEPVVNVVEGMLVVMCPRLDQLIKPVAGSFQMPSEHLGWIFHPHF